MGSTRFPGKVMADLCGKPMLARVIERVAAACLVDRVVLATTENPDDDPVVEVACAGGVESFRGSAEDVLDRYYRAAQQFGADVIVRVTADCPLIDPAVIDRAVATFLGGEYDHVSTAYPVATFPDGLDVWVFSFSALERAWREATLSSDREHVTTYMWRNPHIFRLETVANGADLSSLRWTVDEESDIRMVREVYRHLEDGSGHIFGMGEVLGLLERRPEISTINTAIGRDEGLERSLRRDSLARGD